MKKLLLLWFFALFHFVSSWAQVEIGTGTSTQIYPLGNYYGFERSAALYTGVEVQGVGAISNLAWYANTAGAGARPIKIYLKEVTENQITATSWSSITTGATLVYDGSMTPIVGWNNFVTTAAFNFSGNGNLLVLVEANFGGNGNGGASAGNAIRYTTATNRHMYWRLDSAPPTGDGTSSSSRPNIKISIPMPTCPRVTLTNTALSGTAAYFALSTPIPDLGYSYELRTSGSPGSGATGLVQSGDLATNRIALTGLSVNTAYVLYARGKCSATDSSFWVDSSFTTGANAGQVGIGVATSTDLPLRPNYGYNYSQQIYTKDEMLAAVGADNFITKIKFHIKSSSATTSYKDWKITMGNTSQDVFASTSAWVPQSQLSEVFNGVVPFPSPVDGWMEIELATPFIWDGVSNVVIAVHEYTPGFLSGGVFRKMDTTNNRGIGYHSDTVNPDVTNLAAGALYSFVPQAIFVGGQTPVCVGPINIQMSQLTSTSVKFNWSIFETAPVLGVDYFLSTSPTPPVAGTVPTATLGAAIREIVLESLTVDTQYYVWFRAKCTAAETSNWSAVRAFRTPLVGQVGIGTDTGVDLPIRSSSPYSYSQQIYLKDEVAIAVGANNIIKKIRFHFKTTGATANYKDWKVFMGNTVQEEFATTSAWVPQSQLAEVFSGVITFPNPTDDWMEIVLDTPFIWDGISNIVIGVHEYTPGSATGAVFRKMDTPTKRGMGVYPTTNPNLQSLSSGTAQYYVPQVILIGEPLAACMYPLNIQMSELGSTKVKYSWVVGGTAPYIGVEYFVSSSSIAPVANTTPTGIVNAPTAEVVLTDLNSNTQYYVWFRLKCSPTATSEWSSENSFTTTLVGQIGVGEATGSDLPIRSSSAYNYTQQIYLKTEVVTAIGTDNLINKIRFHIKTTAATANYKDWKVFMGNTSQEVFASGTAYVPQNQLTEVFDGVITFPDPTDGWIEIALDTPFVWDGINNLVIGVHEYTASSTAGAVFKKIDTPTRRGIGLYSSTNPNLQSLGSGTTLDYVPQVILNGSPVPECMFPLNVQPNAVTDSSVEYIWNLFGNYPVEGVEYYLSTSNTDPTAATDVSGMIVGRVDEGMIEGLTENTLYYIWFRVKCSPTSSSEWTRAYSFKTSNTGQIGTGELVTTSLPLQSNYGYNYTQQIYLTPEITAAVGTNRYIKKIKFHFTATTATATYKDWKIFMGNTVKGSFAATSATEWVPTAAMTTVFEGEVTFPNPTGDWMEITLAEPFLWDGTSNIVVAVHEYTPAYLLGGSFRKMDTPGANRGMIYRTDSASSNPNPDSPPVASDRFTYVPQIVLVGEPAPTCIGLASTNHSDVTLNSVKVKWTNTVTVLATEYFYATTLAQAPTGSTVPSGSVNSPALETTITGLQPNTQYYVWFRNKCSATDSSAWTGIPVSFKTPLEGHIGSGEQTTTQLPLTSSSSFNYSQQIYLASEIRASMGGTGQSYITKLKFHFKSTNATANYKDWKIFMGNTTKAEFSATTADQWVSIAALQQVFDGEVTFPNPTDNWMEITLTEPFAWDGTSNIVVAVNEYTTSSTSGANFRKMDTPTYRGLVNSSITLQNLNTPPIATNRYQYVPQIIFEKIAVPACLKPIYVEVVDITKNSATVNWTAPINVPTLGYEYEVRTSGAAGSGQTGLFATQVNPNAILTKALTGLAPATEYSVYLRSKCSLVSNSTWTLATKFTTLCNYTDFTVQNAAICGQGVITLSVTVTGTNGVFKWYEVATGGTVLFEGPAFTTPLLTANKSYWVEGTTGTGTNLCLSGRKKIDVVVSVAPAFTLSTAAFTICEGETSAAVTLTSDASDFTTYTWSPATGVSGNAQTGWVFNPTVSTVYTVIAKQASGALCEAAGMVSITVNPIPVFTTTPDEIDQAVCEGGIKAFEVDYVRDFQRIIGEGTLLSGNNDNNTAFNNRFTGGKSQMIFTAAELNAVGINAGNISSISFNIATPGSRLTNANYVVKVGTTNLNAFANTSFITAGLTTVYGPTTYTHTESGWQEIAFTTPFEWNGTSNVIVEISHTGANSVDNANTYYTVGTENRLLFGTTGTTGTTSKNRYNVILKGQSDLKVTWSPAANLFTDEEATVPYEAGVSATNVYYKGQQEGYENLVLSVDSGNGCPVIKTFNVRTVVITDAEAVDQEFCGAVPVSELVATGQDGARFNWYRQATGGLPLSPTTLLVTGTYYVTQIIGACESTTRKAVHVDIKNKPLAPVSANRNICGTAMLSDLDVTYDAANTLNWYDASQDLIVGDVALQTGIYFVSQSNSVCESEKTRVGISVNPVPAAPTTAASQTFCGTARVSNLAIQLAAGTVAKWYNSMTATTALSPNDFLSTGTYYGAQMSNSCESTRVAVSVVVYDGVALPIAQNQNFCTNNVTVSDLLVTALPGARVNWYNTATGGTALGANQPLTSGLYYATQKIGDCESARVRIGVNIVNNNTAPNALSQSFCGATKVSNLHVNVATGMIVKWYAQEQGGTALANDAAIQTGTYYVSQSIYFCESPRKRVEVVVNPIPATPTGSDLQVFEHEPSSVIGDLVLDQINIIWYSSEEDALNSRNSLSIDMPLVDGSVYFGVLRSDAGCVSLPFAVTVKINKPLGVNDFDLTKLNYYPNPVKDVLTISYKETITRVEVYSLTGQRVLTMNASDYQVLVDMSRLAPATYVVKIYTDNQSQFIKIIKN
ncbi:fibronectin type III domain-containing protein [Flavobacterium sp. JP2137]|uniref:Ig-like domain-containing protein n=1 Tax=Flavobacterium sp. JP2137 TaxID=3414510 RepID=UPI003D2FD7FA